MKWILLLLFGSYVSGKTQDLQGYVLQKVLTPWVSAHYPKFHYVGKENPEESVFSWTFKNVDDPKLRTTFPLFVRMDFVQTVSTAHRYLHRGDNKALKLGDESQAFDHTDLLRGDIGGWINCRIGRCLFSVSCYSMTFEDLKNLSQKIAKSVPQLPEPSSSIRKNCEIKFLKTLFEIEQLQREDDEWTERLKSKTLVTAGELHEKYFKEHPAPEFAIDEHGLSPGARSHFPQASDPSKSAVSEIDLERTGCYGTCPQYAVKITSDGKVEYFGGRYVKRLGNHTGHIPKWSFLELAEFVRDAGVAGMHGDYEEDVTDCATVYTAFVIDGKQKLIRNYANSGPPLLWATEQLIDKLLLETEWDTTEKQKRVK